MVNYCWADLVLMSTATKKQHHKGFYKLASKLSWETRQTNQIYGFHGNNRKERRAHQEASVSLGDVFLHRMGQKSLQERPTCECLWHYSCYKSVCWSCSVFCEYANALIFTGEVSENAAHLVWKDRSVSAVRGNWKEEWECLCHRGWSWIGSGKEGRWSSYVKNNEYVWVFNFFLAFDFFHVVALLK